MHYLFCIHPIYFLLSDILFSYSSHLFLCAYSYFYRVGTRFHGSPVKLEKVSTYSLRDSSTEKCYEPLQLRKYHGNKHTDAEECHF